MGNHGGRSKFYLSLAAVGVLTIGVAVFVRDPHGAIWTEAKKAVSAKLLTPSTAVFPGGKQERLISELESDKPGTRVFHVASYVDAQNQYGALIRRDWTVFIEKTGSALRVTEVTFHSR